MSDLITQLRQQKPVSMRTRLQSANRMEDLQAVVDRLADIADRINVIRHAAEKSPFYDSENTKTALFICDSILEMIKDAAKHATEKSK